MRQSLHLSHFGLIEYFFDNSVRLLKICRCYKICFWHKYWCAHKWYINSNKQGSFCCWGEIALFHDISTLYKGYRVMFVPTKKHEFYCNSYVCLCHFFCLSDFRQTVQKLNLLRNQNVLIDNFAQKQALHWHLKKTAKLENYVKPIFPVFSLIIQ